MVEEAIAEHHVFPEVDLLAEQLRKLEFSLVFDQFWVEEALRNLHVLQVPDEEVEPAETLRDAGGPLPL